MWRYRMVCALVASLVAGGAVRADDVLYGLDSAFSPTLVTIDPLTGEILTSVEVDTPFLLGGLASDGAGRLYSIVGAQDLQPDVLVRIDTVTGEAIPVGTLSGDWFEDGLAVNPVDGTMYLFGDNNLYVVDPATASTTLIGKITGDVIGTVLAIAINSKGEAYTTDLTGRMFVLNLATGDVDFAWDPELMGSWYEDLAFAPDGLLYGPRVDGVVAVLDVDEQTDEVLFEGTYVGMTFAPGGCAPDCNADGLLNVLDFVCFQQAWTSEAPLGDCDANGVYNVLDFVCFQSLFGAGCN